MPTHAASMHGDHADNRRNAIMRTLLLAAVAAIALQGPAHAGKIGCILNDEQGNALAYVFDDSFSDTYDNGEKGTVREEAFSKNHHDVIAPEGSKPVWTYEKQEGGFMLEPKAGPPGWKLLISTVNKGAGDGWKNNAGLYHDEGDHDKTVALGACIYSIKGVFAAK
jgi:hypothetical protein